MAEQLKDLYLQNKQQKIVWENFLADRGIQTFSDQEMKAIDQTIGLYDETGRLVGTGSIAGNILKYVAVCNQGMTTGARFNQIISELVGRLAQQNIFHVMVFTKPAYVESFKHVGFRPLALSSDGALLEKGEPDISDYLASLPEYTHNQKLAAIVMNANPFTLGHRYLVETAARENDHVYVFVVNQDASLFTTDERMALIQAGTTDLKNVTVVSGGAYMVSFVTFPAYFIDSPDEVINYQTTLDARLFKNKIAEPLGITTRYLGSEPYSHTTDLYNQALQRELEPEIQVKILPRKENDQGVAISATAVRQAIQNNQPDEVKQRVPHSTERYVLEHWGSLRERIEKRS